MIIICKVLAVHFGTHINIFQIEGAHVNVPKNSLFDNYYVNLVLTQ